MNEFWEGTMNYLLGVILYHGRMSDEDTWYKQYQSEINHIIEDIKNFHQSNIDMGFEISNESMARFLIYTEHEHIGNTHLINECTVNENQLLMIAAQILDELNSNL